MKLRNLLILLVPLASYAQGIFIPPRTVEGTVNGITRPIAGATVTVCAANIGGIPCSPALANTVFQDSALTIPRSNPFTTDANGNYPQAALAGGVYTITESAAGFTGFSYQVTVSCAPGAGCTVSTFAASSATIAGALTATVGPNLFSCKRINGVRCIDTTANNAWNGATACSSDIGACINAAITDCNGAGTGCPIQIAPGTYTQTTSISVTQAGVRFDCPGGPDATVITYTPATGNAIFVNNSNTSFAMDGCFWKTSTSTSSVGIFIQYANQVDISRFHLNGFFGGIRVTGDGVSTHSLGVRVQRGLIDGFTGTGSYGMNADHVRDWTLEKMEFYSANNSITSIPLIIDTGAQALWASGVTLEQGLHAGIIRNSGQGGAYDGAPAAFFMDSITWDNAPGGDDLLFDSTLSTTDIKFFCTKCWAAVAGRNTALSIVTNTAVGFNIQGGSNIHFTAGTVRGNSNWGAVVNTTGSDISFTDVNFYGNNQCGVATCPGVGGIQVTANPTNVRLIGNRSGNVVESGGNQVYGADLSAAGATVYFCGNDFRNNSTARIKFPAALAAQTYDAPECGSTVGSFYVGGIGIGESTAPSGASTAAVCYADSTAHTLKCSYNNGSFFNIPQTVASGTAVMTTAGITGPACGATVTVSAAGVTTTDTITWAFNAAPAANPGELVVSAWPTAGNVNFQYCLLSGTVTPNAATLNWRVVR